MGRRWIVLLFSFLPFLFVFPPQLAARIPLLKGTEDVRDPFRSASLAFHGRVLTIQHRSIELDSAHPGGVD